MLRYFSDREKKENSASSEANQIKILFLQLQVFKVLLKSSGFEVVVRDCLTEIRQRFQLFSLSFFIWFAFSIMRLGMTPKILIKV